jgi:hypothetical protein
MFLGNILNPILIVGDKMGKGMAWEHWNSNLIFSGNIFGQKKQQERYVEFVLRGGTSSRDIYWNCAGWMGSYKGPMYLVDGKQRLQAARLFMNNKLKVFGHTLSEFEGVSPLMCCDFIFHVNNLETKSEVIQWYLDLNFGGTPHTDSERKRVLVLLEQTKQ